MDEKSMMLFDIGANCGNYTSNNIHKYDKVICVDASKLQCDILRTKMPLDKCTVVHALVSNSPDTKFYVCSSDGISSASREWIMGKGRFAPGGRYWDDSIKWEGDRHPAPVLSLDELIRQYGTPSFIKIDVEGHELEVVKSLTKYSGALAFEWAEEMKEEIIKTINYIYDVLGHTEFYIQPGDTYTFVPDEGAYTDKESVFKYIEENCISSRQELWGMIWSRVR
jgi:FkbM family methyltransferase